MNLNPGCNDKAVFSTPHLNKGESVTFYIVSYLEEIDGLYRHLIEYLTVMLFCRVK